MASEIVKYEQPLSAPLRKQENARMLLLSHQARLGDHLARAADVGVEEIVSTAITEIATAEPAVRDKLLLCTGQSVLKAVADACRYGLVFGKVLGQAYLIPRKDQCCLDVGYRGYEALVYRSGAVKALQSGIVFEGDEFDYEIGRQPPIRHRPKLDAKHTTDKIVAVYVQAHLDVNLAIAEVMNREDVCRIAARSRRRVSLYDTEPEMWRKAPIKRIAKHLPLSPSYRTLLDEIILREEGLNEAQAGPGEEVLEGEARARFCLEGVQSPEPVKEKP